MNGPRTPLPSHCHAGSVCIAFRLAFRLLLLRFLSHPEVLSTLRAEQMVQRYCFLYAGSVLGMNAKTRREISTNRTPKYPRSDNAVYQAESGFHASGQEIRREVNALRSAR